MAELEAAKEKLEAQLHSRTAQLALTDKRLAQLKQGLSQANRLLQTKQR